MARRSARLSSRKSSTPQPIKRASLSHDGPIRAPRTVPSKLASLQENDEMPGSFPESPTSPSGPSKRVRIYAITPERAKPLAPAHEEMHPHLHHQSTTKPHEDARWLGFSTMASHTEPPSKESRFGFAPNTPSRATKIENPFKSPDFQFTFHREQSLELSPAAKKLMQEKRAEALRIREQMKAEGDTPQKVAETLDRKVATPKSQKGRFSAAHSAQFDKMDSIAGHASAYRKDPSKVTVSTPDSKAMEANAKKSLKRSPSKAELDKEESTPVKYLQHKGGKQADALASSQLPRSAMKRDAIPLQNFENQSPSKRLKRSESDDTAVARPTSAGQHSHHPATPQQKSRPQPNLASLDHLTTPTQSSLARAASVKSVSKSTRIPAPANVQTPSKTEAIKSGVEKTDKTSTPLLAKSPAKCDIFGTGPIGKPSGMLSPILARTAAKSGMLESKGPLEKTEEKEKVRETPLLARSPSKAFPAKNTESDSMAVAQSSIPLFSRTPIRAPSNRNPFDNNASTGTPSQARPSNLLGRFNLLRSSPIKSILRSPQRLYSDDPTKVAAGTHFATPPRVTKDLIKRDGPATAPVQKHVDFTSSVKAREASKEASSSPMDNAAQKSEHIGVAPVDAVRSASVAYPSLPSASPGGQSPSPHRRQTAAPGDFTFRVGTEIVFAPSPSPKKSFASPLSSRTPTIRHVSAEPGYESLKENIHATGSKKRKMDFENALSAAQTEPSPTMTPGSKKRKFDFENELAKYDADHDCISDKENSGAGGSENDTRPTKRSRTNPASVSSALSAATKTAARTASQGSKKRPTLGVRPKSAVGKPPVRQEKKNGGTTISMARLSALAQPKKRS